MDAFLSVLGGAGGSVLGSTAGSLANGGWSTTTTAAGGGLPSMGGGGGGADIPKLPEASQIKRAQPRQVDIAQLLQMIQQRGGLGT